MSKRQYLAQSPQEGWVGSGGSSHLQFLEFLPERISKS